MATVIISAAKEEIRCRTKSEKSEWGGGRVVNIGRSPRRLLLVSGVKIKINSTYKRS